MQRLQRKQTMTLLSTCLNRRLFEQQCLQQRQLLSWKETTRLVTSGHRVCQLQSLPKRRRSSRPTPLRSGKNAFWSNQRVRGRLATLNILADFAIGSPSQRKSQRRQSRLRCRSALQSRTSRRNSPKDLLFHVWIFGSRGARLRAVELSLEVL